MVQYCMLNITGKFMSSRKDIDVDFGIDENSIFKSNDDIIQQTAKVNGKDTLIDGLNYMASIGWEVVHLTPFETDTDGGTFENYRYLMKRTF